jgi:hypothetical protein
VWNRALDAIQKQVLLKSFGWTRKTVLIADASNVGRGFWLMQLDAGDQMHIIMLKSKAWKKTQQLWSTIRKEYTALIEALQDSEHFVRYCYFTLLTDHRPLLWLLRQVQLNPTMWGGAALRAVIYLSQFSCDFKHIAGLANLVADLLSRYPFRRDLEAKGDKVAPDWFVESLKHCNDLQAVSSVINFIGTSVQSVDAAISPKVADGEKKNVAKAVQSRSTVLDAIMSDPPMHVLELSKLLGLFQPRPNFPQDVFVVLAEAKLKGIDIPKKIAEQFSEVLEEVDSHLSKLSFSQGRLHYGSAFYVPIEGREAFL